MGLAAPVPVPDLPGVTVLDHTEQSLRLVVDTRVTAVRRVLDALLTGPAVVDVSVVDPPLEQVIADSKKHDELVGLAIKRLRASEASATSTGGSPGRGGPPGAGRP